MIYAAKVYPAEPWNTPTKTDEYRVANEYRKQFKYRFGISMWIDLNRRVCVWVWVYSYRICVFAKSTNELRVSPAAFRDSE